VHSVDAPDPGVRYAARATLLVALAGSVAITWSQSPLTYDGSAILLRTVHHRLPFITHGRWITAVVKFPAALSVTVTNSLPVARVMFSLAYALLPVLAAWLAWLVVRRDAPHLGVWAALGIFVATAPGLVFAVSEAETIVQFTWPLLLLVLLGLRRRTQQVAAAALVATMVTLHPFAVALLVMAGLLALLGALLGRVARWPAVAGAFAMFVVAGARYLVFDPYEKTQTTRQTLRDSFRHSVAGGPLRALVLALVAGVAIVVVRRVRLPRVAAALLVVAPLVAAVAVFAWWASDVTRWRDASGFRGWVLAASLPFYALAVLDAWLPTSRGPSAAALRPVLGAASIACAGVFAVTSILQGAGWHRLMGDVERNVARSRPVCTTRAAVLPTPRGPTYHWASNSLAIIVQDRRAPKHIVLDDRRACVAFEHGARPAVVGHRRILKPLHGWIRLPAP